MPLDGRDAVVVDRGRRTRAQGGDHEKWCGCGVIASWAPVTGRALPIFFGSAADWETGLYEVSVYGR